MLQLPVTHRRGPNYQRAIRYRIGHAPVFFSACQQRGSAHGGARLAKSHIIRIDHAQMEKAKVAHGTGRRAYIERVARRHQHHAQMLEFSPGRQEGLFYDA